MQPRKVPVVGQQVRDRVRQALVALAYVVVPTLLVVGAALVFAFLARIVLGDD